MYACISSISWVIIETKLNHAANMMIKYLVNESLHFLQYTENLQCQPILPLTIWTE